MTFEYMEHKTAPHGRRKWRCELWFNGSLIHEFLIFGVRSDIEREALRLLGGVPRVKCLIYSAT